jgi:hypothetical protein
MVIKTMNVEPRGRFENLDLSEHEETHTRQGNVKLPKLAKSSQKERRYRRPAKLRNINAINVLRSYGLRNKVNETSIYSLVQILRQHEVKSLTPWGRAKAVKTAFYQLAMKSIEEQATNKALPFEERLILFPFTMNLSPKLLQQMEISKRPELTTCMEKIKKSLEKHINREVEIWFHIEMAPKAGKGKPHIQGAMLISRAEEKAAKQTLHFANGGHIARAVVFSLGKRQTMAKTDGLLYTDVNWASYSSKEQARTRLQFFDDNLFVASRGLNQRAKQLFEELREELKK